MQETLIELVELIHKYYLIGAPTLQEKYKGFQGLKAMINNKHSLLTDAKKMEPWNKLLTSMANDYLTISMYDLGVTLSPSLKLTIPLSTTDDSVIQRRQTIYLTTSLLGNYYTIFLVEEYFYAIEDPKNPVLKKIEFDRGFHKEIEVKIFEDLQKYMGLYFPNHKYLEYNFLKQEIQGGWPYGESDLKIGQSFPIYDFIFGKY